MPTVIAVALTAAVLWRQDFRAFWFHLQRVNYVAYLSFCAVFLVVNLAADSIATSFVYRRTVCGVKTGEFFLVRGASYLPSLINHHVGQAWLTWYLSRTYKAPLWRVAGATLLVYATTFGSLGLFGAASLLFDHRQAPWLAPLLGVGAVAGVGYLIVIRIAPPVLAKRQLLAPLFEVGVRGHLEALALRIPHMLVLFLGSWLCFHFFNVRIPIAAACAYVPILMVIVALPVTPQGVGTRDWFSVQYFSQFGSGTHAEQEAAVLATTLTWAIGLSLVQVAVSMVLMRRAMRMLAEQPQQPEPTDTPPPATQ